MMLNTTRRGTESPTRTRQYLMASVSRCVVVIGAMWIAAIAVAAGAEPTLLDAAERGDRATALSLLAKGADPNTPGPDGTTAIMWAASNDDIELVRALIKAGANVKLKNQFGTSAITEAAIVGSAPVIDALLKAGADPNTKNPEGETPLMAVARSGNVRAATLLLEARADVNAREEFGGQTALMWAAAQSQAEMVKLLASKGADLNARGVIRQWERKVITEPRPKDMNRGGFTPLLYAAREGCVECVRHLIEAGADLNLEDPERITPLVMALMNLHFEVAASLVKAGADVDKWDLFGRSPLYMAADVSTLPVKGNGAVAVLPSEDSMTALDVARMLLEAGANPNLQLKPAVSRRPAGSRRRHDTGAGGDAVAARGARRGCAVRRAPAEAQGARRSAKQGRGHAVDGGGGCRVRHACHAWAESHQRRRAGDHATAARCRRRRQRPDGDRLASQR
jgi:uncharacterized protein